MPQQIYFPMSTFLAGIQKTLRDEYGVVFDMETELLPVFNLGTSEIVNADPEALVKNEPFLLAPSFASIAVPGATYADGDILTAAGGTFTRAATFLVAGTNAGAVDMVVPIDYGSYTAYPANPVSTTGGAGTGAQINLKLVGGKQELPPDGANLISVRRNLGIDGQTIGPIIEECQIDEISAWRSGWATDICGINGAPALPIHWMSVKEDAKRFYLWPYPNVMAAPWYVELIYRAVPDSVGINDNFPLPALYMPAAKYYTCAHAMLRLDSNDKRFEKCGKLISVFMGLFEKSLGMTNAAVVTTKPPHPLNRRRQA